ncbi:hypothetical protein ACTU3I_01770 [Microbacterium sp. RD1]|uniref:hypothetical protein n=1 Tax=Microbacterium sp. RD1 TaxID=3457313 RepID=UPI003FA57593
MLAVWAAVTEVWWVAPAAAGAGVLGWAGLRTRSSSRARRIELEAAQQDVTAARDAVRRARAAVLAARAAVARAEADRTAARAHPGEIAAARQAVQQAERNVRAASADLRARRADVTAARAAIPAARADPSQLPLARLLAEHDALRSRWVAYETDAAKLIEYPAMSDPSAPETAAFLRAQATAQWLRPASAAARMRPADFAAYRDAVRQAQRAFDVAERAARRQNGEPDPESSGSERWAEIARDVVDSTSRAIALSAEALARAAAWRNRRRRSD